MGKKPIVSETYENERSSIIYSLLYIKCVTSLLCGPWADLWPFYGLYCKRFSLYIKGYSYIERKPFTVVSIIHKTAINRPIDHTGET